MENSPIRFIQSYDADGAIVLEKISNNIGLTDSEINVLKNVISQWRDAYAMDAPAVCVHEMRLHWSSVVKRIERELERALDRPETHFE